MARKVGDDCLVVEWQAEPVDTQMPASSRWTRMFSPSTYSKEMFEVFGSRFVRSGVPFRRALGICLQNFVLQFIAQLLNLLVSFQSLAPIRTPRPGRRYLVPRKSRRAAPVPGCRRL